LSKGFDTGEKVVDALVELVRRAVFEAKNLRTSGLQTGSQLVVDVRRSVMSPPAPPTINTAPGAPSTGYRTPRTFPRGVEISAVCCESPGSAASEVIVTPLLPSPSPLHPATLEKTTPANPTPPSTRNVRRLIALPTNISVASLNFEGRRLIPGFSGKRTYRAGDTPANGV
jgi:hypothetical protein